VPHRIDNLGGAVEAYLSSHFSGFPNGVPPPGLYHRILKEIEVPLLTAGPPATRRNQTRAADRPGMTASGSARLPVHVARSLVARRGNVAIRQHCDMNASVP
jgi:hypothetical protein